ncbi:hypothetical protein [Haladaptatus sp. NG-SE-30]
MPDSSSPSRRRFLALVGTAGGAVTAGCFGSLASGSGIVGKRFETVDPRRSRKSRPIIVAFDDNAQEVQVTGFMWYGGGCDKASLKTATYEPEADRLRVVLDPTRKLLSFGGCTAAMGGTHYRVTVAFASSLPRTVEVVEHNAGQQTPEQRTVDREAQEELCTGVPETNEERATAHWTCPEQYIAMNNDTQTTTNQG